MAKRRRDQVDQGRGYFETSSPFETFEPAQNRGKPKTYRGLTDTFDLPRNLMTGPQGEAIMPHIDPEQYDNPRGYPGLAMITSGSETSKLPLSARDKGHSIMHHMEGEGSLADTGKDGRRKSR